jgi:hypothetical protein
MYKIFPYNKGEQFKRTDFLMQQADSNLNSKLRKHFARVAAHSPEAQIVRRTRIKTMRNLARKFWPNAGRLCMAELRIGRCRPIVRSRVLFSIDNQRAPPPAASALAKFAATQCKFLINVRDGALCALLRRRSGLLGQGGGSSRFPYFCER